MSFSRPDPRIDKTELRVVTVSAIKRKDQGVVFS